VISCRFLSRFLITQFVITETLLIILIFKTIMVPLHRGRLRFAVVHLYSGFSMDCQEKQIFTIFGTFGGCKLTFLTHNVEIWCEGEDLGLPLPRSIL